MKRGLVFAMESENEAAVVADVENVTTSELVDDVETTAEETEELVEMTDEAHEDIDTLEQVQDVMTDSIESGEGLSPEAAEMAEIVTESICRRMGIRNTRVIPNMESFGSNGSRLSATRLAFEGISDVIEKIWKAIKDAFKKVMSVIQDLYKKFFDGATKIKAQAKALITKAQERSYGDTDEDELELNSVYSAFKDPTKTEFDTNNVTSIINTHVKVSSQLMFFPNVAKDVVKDVKDAASKAPENVKVNILDAVVKTLDSKLGSSFKDVPSSDKKYNDLIGAEESKTAIKKSDNLSFQNAMFFITSSDTDNPAGANAPAEDGTGQPYKGGMRFKFVLTSVNEYEDKITQDDMKVPVLKQSEMFKICNSVIDLASVTINFNEELKKIKDLDKMVDDIYNKMVSSGRKEASTLKDADGKSAPKSAKNEFKTVARFLSNAMRDVLNSINSAIVSLPKQNIRAGRLALDYVSASISAYKLD